LKQITTAADLIKLEVAVMAFTKVVATILLIATFTAGQQTPPQETKPAAPAQQTPKTPPKKESTIDWLLRIAGITVTSNKQKGDKTDDAGVIWIADLVANESTSLRQDGNFRWPIFLTDNRGILALRNNDVVLLNLNGKDERIVATVPKLVKLVASSLDNHDEVLVVMKNGASWKLGTLSLSSGQVSTPEFETKEVVNGNGLTEEQLAVDVAMGSERESGKLKVYVETVDAGSERSRSDVMLIIDKSGPIDPPTNLSNCNGAKCSQPSISIEGRYVAFIKAPVNR
jgi:hypothetical protein